MRTPNDNVESGAKLAAEHFGDLRGINAELANTIANLYYVFYAGLPESVQELVHANMTKQAKQIEESLYGNLTFDEHLGKNYQFIKRLIGDIDDALVFDYAFICACIEHLPSIVRTLKQIDEEVNSGRCSLSNKRTAEELAISIYKYRIIDAPDHSKLRNLLQRKMRGHPKEAPGLARRMGLV
jgi:hypothetical protein